jgi:hypothetical protein
MIQKLCSSICGIEPERVAKASNHSQRKVVILGLCTLIPTTMWMISAFLTAKAVSDNLMISVGAAIVFSTLVFVIEKSIVSNPGKLTGLASFVRAALAFVVAILGSLTLDQIIFENDIQAEIDKIKSEEKSGLLSSRYKINGYYDDTARYTTEYNSINKLEAIYANGAALGFDVRKVQIQNLEVAQRFQSDYNQYNTAVNQIRIQYQNDPVRMQNEIRSLRKPIRPKELPPVDLSSVNNLKSELGQKRSELAVLDSAISRKRNEAIEETSKILSSYDNSLLQKYRATFNMLSNNLIVFIPYLVFFLLLLLLELLPLVLKRSMANTQLERELAMEDLVLPQNFPLK